MNYSRQREVILQTLKDNVVHPTAEYLYAILKEKEPNMSLATLYRNLNQLADNGIIKKIDGLKAPLTMIIILMNIIIFYVKNAAEFLM